MRLCELNERHIDKNIGRRYFQVWKSFYITRWLHQRSLFLQTNSHGIHYSQTTTGLSLNRLSSPGMVTFGVVTPEALETILLGTPHWQSNFHRRIFNLWYKEWNFIDSIIESHMPCNCNNANIHTFAQCYLERLVGCCNPGGSILDVGITNVYNNG